MPEELGEKTEDPTTRRMSEARGRGQVAKSQDLSAAVDLIGGVIMVVVFGGVALTTLGRIMERVLADETTSDPVTLDGLYDAAVWAAAQAAWIVVPMLLVMFVVAYIGQVMQVGLLISGYPIQPKLERMNPIKGISRLFNLRNFVKSIVNILKLILITLVAALVSWRHVAAMTALPSLELLPAMYRMGLIALELVAWMLLILLIIGLLDFLYQRWQHTRDLRMTKQEVKDERRSMDGDPEIRARRLRMARDVALQRINQAVPQADVVVTNPTHFSVALKYDAGAMRAPRVVAKGADYMAFRIRHLAIASRVPIVERAPLARGLYWGVDVGQEISPEFYEAVAEVLAYVYRIQGREGKAA